MTKLEEVARAIREALSEGTPGRDPDRMERVARAAVEALRVPSDAMITAAYDVQAYWHHDVSELESEWRGEMRKEYQAMLDAILKEKP